MNKLYTILCGVLLLGVISCLKDQGTYGAKQDINEISISGIDTLYVVDAGKRTVIRPDVAFSIDETPDTANYSYKWVAAHMIGLTNAAKTVATTRDLDTVISNLDIGSHFMYYRVTDKRTGLFQDKYFTLTLGSPDYEGWLTYCDTEDGKSRLDIISRRGPIDTLYRDVLSVVGSAFKTDGKPGFMTTNVNVMGIASGELAVIIGTENKAAVLGRNSLQYLPANDLDKFFNVTVPITSYAGASFARKQEGGVLHLNGKHYLFGRRTITGPFNRTVVGGPLFKASPFVAQNVTASAAGMIVFDEDSKTFFRYANGATCLALPKGSLFDYNIKMDLLWMEYVPYESGQVFAVLKDATTKKVHLARFTLAGAQVSFDEITAPDIANAEHFAIHPESGYIIYNVGSKIYEYDFTNKKNLLMADYHNRPITILKFHPFNYTTITRTINKPFYESLAKKLVVCTWDGQDAKTSGILDLYTVPDINARFIKYKSYPGTGKVAFVGYRER